MENSKQRMLLSLIEHYTGGNKSKFAKMLGISAQSVSTWIARSTFDAELIYSKCEDVSASWLLSGRGDMIVTGSNTSADAKQAIYDLTIENGRLKKRIAELEGKKGGKTIAS